jgi:hypothetical protein
MLKSLKDNTHAVVDLTVVLMIGIAFTGLKNCVRMQFWPDGDCVYHMDDQ